MRHRKSLFRERRHNEGIPIVPFKDSHGATIWECRRKILDRRNYHERNFMHKSMRLEKSEKINAMTTLESVAYANWLSSRLKCDDCTDEEKKNGLEILRRLNERVHFLKISSEPPKFCRIGVDYFAESSEAI